MAVEVDILKYKFTFMAPYMPHSGYDDVAVEEVYEAMSTLHKKALRRKRTTIIAGDWNAIPGICKPGDDRKVLGNYGLGPRNCRGEWMLRWASLERFRILNTFFEKPFASVWTFTKGGRQRQLDFICIDQSGSDLVVDACSTDAISLGIDHKTVMAEFLLDSKIQKRNRSGRTSRTRKGWKPTSERAYASTVDERLARMRIENDYIGNSLSEKCECIERVILETAHSCKDAVGIL